MDFPAHLRTRIAGLATLFVLSTALLLAACGGGSGSGSGSGGDSTVPVAPVITAQPQSTSVTTGSTATFSAAANGAPTPTFQWQLSTDSGANWSSITSATASSYTTPATAIGDSGNQYRAVASNSAGSATSSPATLTVTALPLAVKAVPLDAGDGPPYVCALRAEGTVACWGGNDWGNLGDGTTIERDAPTTVPGLANVVAITTGSGHACALKADGSVACWGRNDFAGELGDGTTTNSSTPVAVSGLTDAVAIAAGNVHTCALKSNGTVACWGSNGGGSLGDGTTTDRHTPVAVAGLANVVAITAGLGDTCALRDDGTAACWGDNGSGQGGNGSQFSPVKTPVAVSGLTHAVAIVAGYDHVCALKDDGRVVCWGNNALRQLGDGSANNYSTTPTGVVGLTDAAAISAGLYFSCALKADGTAVCWGNNSSGQLGDGSTASLSTTPVAVSGLTGAVAIASGGNHSCALRTDGSMVCWGSGGRGELGNGDNTANATSPVNVSGGAVFWR